ncbi:uncharacterized protein C5orf52 homolog [Cavia porcellus]|uniref:uncharacterized protein C5orf52 homolog n=1 Tax=Cavia porcellus TaxID=10141 RepID=UPI00022B77C6|nr:uncharacterized protein C5orf52 homolog [Cavia porcellus]
MATTRQHKPRRPQRDNSAASQPRRTRPFSRPRPSCVSRVTGGAQLPGYRPLSGLLKLAHVPEQSCGLKYEAAQPCKPSVKWDLDSSTDYEIPAKVTSSSAATCCPNFRRDRLERRQEVSAGPGPQVIFLPPRTAHHPVLFSLMNCSEVAVRKVLPKSRLSQVIMHDNLHGQRTYELQERALEKARKKTSQWYEHLKKKFIADQMRKIGHWRQESMKIQPYLDSLRVYEIQMQLNSSKKRQKH